MSIRRFLSALTVAMLMLATLVVPAHADVVAFGGGFGSFLPRGTGTINVTVNNFAGPEPGNEFDDTTNDVPQSGTVCSVGSDACDEAREGTRYDDNRTELNAVTVEIPTQFEITGVRGPDGWNVEFDQELSILFATANEGAEIPVRGSAGFQLDAIAPYSPEDRGWSTPIHASDDGGITLTPIGNVFTSVFTMAMDVVEVVKPLTASNPDPGLVTASQDNVQVRMVARSFTDEDRTVTFSAQGRGFPEDENDQFVPEMSADTAEATLPANGTVTGLVNAQFNAETGEIAIDGFAESAGGSFAGNGTNALVQQAFDATYVEDSFRPNVLVRGQQYETISLDVEEISDAGATLDTTLTITGVLTADGQVTVPVDPSTSTVSFQDVTVPAAAIDGSFPANVRFTGVDANGATVDVTTDIGQVVLDSLAPVLDVVADVGDSEVTGATPAASDGRDIGVSGPVTLNGLPCADCTVTDAVVVTDGGARLPFDASVVAGQLMGTANVTFPVGTTSAVVSVTVARPSGLGTTDDSDDFEVDIIDPVLDRATTGRDAQGDFVDVTISELVNATDTLVTDFTVSDETGNRTILSATPRPQADGALDVRLRLSGTLDDNATPEVTYSPSPLLGGPMIDRVAQPVLDTVLRAVDGIAPEAPVITQVQGLGLQDGEFWTNQLRPQVTVAGISIGDTLRLYYDLNDDGKVDGGDRLVYDSPTTSETETVDLRADLAAGEARHRLLAALHDGESLGALDAEFLNIDLTPPVIVDFTVSPTDPYSVVVTFSEKIARGRDAAFDWTVTAVQGTETASRTVTAVVGSGDTRTLTVSAASYDPAAGAITAVRFKYRGAPADRYNDRATNLLLDQEAG